MALAKIFCIKKKEKNLAWWAITNVSWDLKKQGEEIKMKLALSLSKTVLTIIS